MLLTVFAQKSSNDLPYLRLWTQQYSGLLLQFREDLVKALNKLYNRKDQIDHIIIETTGLANPGPIVSSFYMDQDLPDRVRLDGIVTVVDAKHVSRHLDEAEKDADRVSEAVEQVCEQICNMFVTVNMAVRLQ